MSFSVSVVGSSHICFLIVSIALVYQLSLSSQFQFIRSLVTFQLYLFPESMTLLDQHTATRKHVKIVLRSQKQIKCMYVCMQNHSDWCQLTSHQKLSFRGPQIESCNCPMERAYDDVIVTHKNSLRYKLRTHLCHI